MNQPEKNEIIFDSRIVQRNIRDGRLSRADFESHLKALPDLEEKAEDIGEEIYGAKRTGLMLTGDYVSNERDEE